jgi:hypothetical protein
MTTEKMPNPKEALSARTRILQILQKSPEGVNPQDLLSTLGIPSGTLSSGIMALRKHHNIPIVDGKYFYRGERAKASKDEAPPSPSSSILDGFKKKDIAKIHKKLKPDFYDLLRKAVFYKMSAEALLKTNTYIENLKEELGDIE